MRIHRKKYLLEKQIENKKLEASDIDSELVTGYRGFYNICLKRMLDVILAVFILICISPLFVLIACLILLEDGFPILYQAERGGYRNKKFRIYKFRSMVKNADKIGGGTTAFHDSRITKVGNVIRKIKLDELPNLLNVIKGEMSFIGPRPELLKYTKQYKGTEKLILAVRPGLTDFSSLEFINLDEIVGEERADEVYEQKVLPWKNKLRVKYAAMVSFPTDIKLFILTMWKVIEKGYCFLIKKEHR